MSLQLITGNSGGGKSHLLYSEIIKKAQENPDINYIIIVPEQFTMATQKELVTMHPEHAIMNIDVLSFQRLAFRIFGEIGSKELTILEDTGKSLILRKLASANEEKLQVLSGNINKIGYINEIKSMISELAQYDVSPEKINKITEKNKNISTGLQKKLADIQLLFQEFNTFIEEKFITAEQILEVLYQEIERSDIIKNSVIAFDSFTGFTPIQSKVFAKILTLSKMVFATVTIDARENADLIDEDYKLFHLSKRTIGELRDIAKEAKVPVLPYIVVGKETRPRYVKSKPLEWLEQNLFRYSKNIFEKEQSDISIHAGKTPKAELEYVAKEIHRLIREEGYRYKDIAVVTGDMELYSNYVEPIFEKYEIPTFLDMKKSVLYNPFIEFIRAALQVIEHNFSYESVFRYLRSDMTKIAREDVDLMENYVLAMGIRGKRGYEKKWIRLMPGISEESLIKINEVRKILVEQFEGMLITYKRKHKSVYEQAKCLYEFIVEREVERQLKEKEEFFEETGDRGKAKEYRQIYKSVMDLLDKVVELLGEDVILLQEFTEILDAGFEEVRIGIIPPGSDRITVGDIERTRLDHIKILFFAGVNDGIIPSTSSNGGIISQLEREQLSKSNIRLAPTARERAYTQRFYLYMNMTKPEEKLYITYSKLNGDGKSIRSSYLVGTIQKMFPLIKIEDEEEKQLQLEVLEDIMTPKSSMKALIMHMRRYKAFHTDAEIAVLYAWYAKQEEWKEKVEKILEAVFYQRSEDSLNKSVAKALYGEVLEGSVTRLEKYAQCAFAHFLTYGLRLRERLEYQFASLDMGNIFHESLRIFSEKVANNSLSWIEIDEETRKKYINESIDEAILASESTVLFSSARNSYMIVRIRKILEKTVWALGEQLKRGKFIPEKYEVSFSNMDQLSSLNVELANKEKMRLRGRIDRLDLYEDDENVYVKIIDYKSGNTKFDLLELYYGLQLQLVVYLNAAVELQKKEKGNKTVIPAGIFYYNLKNPILNKDKIRSEEEIDEQMLKELCVNGLVNSDSQVIEALDEEFDGKSNVIPVRQKKDNTFYEGSPVASDGQFKVLSEFVNKKIREIGEDIVNGTVACNPYQMKDQEGCRYCEYNGICRFDVKNNDGDYRRLHSLTAELIWKKMQEEI